MCTYFTKLPIFKYLLILKLQKSSITSKLDKANVDISELIDRQQSLSIVHKNLKDDASDDNNSFEISGDFSD